MDEIPPTVTTLHVSSEFNQPLHLLHASLTHLTLRESFTHFITSLPSSLIGLYFAKKCPFNHPITCLPSSLQELKFGKIFNSSPEPLPNSLTSLKFRKRFNQTLSSLPLSLLYLRFKHYNLPLPILPPKLLVLEMRNYQQPLPPLPKSLNKLLIFTNPYLFPINAKDTSLSSLSVETTNTLIVPPSLTTLITFNNSGPFPPSLRYLYLTNSIIPSHFVWPDLIILDFDNCTFDGIIIWPPNLRELCFENKVGININNLPPKLTNLTLSSNFDQPINNLPNSLTHLLLGNDFNQPIDNLPSSLIHLTIGNLFNHPINLLPPSLFHLEIGNSFNRPIKRLPPSLRTLLIGPSKLSSSSSFNQKITTLPKLHELTLPSSSLSCGALPNSISMLKITPIFDNGGIILHLPVFLKKFEIDFIRHGVRFVLEFNFISWQMELNVLNMA